MYFSSIFTAVHFQTFKTLFVWKKKKKNRIVSLKTITFLRWLLLPILFSNKIYYVLFYIKTEQFISCLSANDTNLINKINQKESPFATNTFITITFPLYHNITTNNDNYDTSNLIYTIHLYTYIYLFISFTHLFQSNLSFHFHIFESTSLF